MLKINIFISIFLALNLAQIANAENLNYAVVTDHKLATDNALDILKKGGNAADATVVAQLILTLVEPQSSGIGGGAFALFWHNKTKQLHSYDGRETAPLNAQENYFFDDNNQPLKWDFNTVRAAKSVGVPGTLALLKKMHQQYGNLPWDDLLDRVIKIAKSGYVLDKKIHRNLIFAQEHGLDSTFKTAYNFYFQQDGQPKPIGTMLKNPAFAQTLETLKTDGIQAFYGGSIAKKILRAIYAADKQAKSGQQINLKDFSNYQVKMRAPICSAYRHYQVCGMGPPSSGALTTGQILGMLEHFDMKKIGFSAKGIHLFAEASKLAYADRALYMADSDFVDMPTQGLLDTHYLHQRAQLIKEKIAAKTPVSAGNPPAKNTQSLASSQQKERPSTSHFNVVDADGNVVSITTTIEQGFGSGIMVGGFMLNNELTDFSFKSHANGKKIANRIEGGKRPRSSMSPSIVFNADKQPILAIGSPGGSRIITYVAGAIIAMLDWDMPPKQALDLGHFSNRNSITELEKNSDSEAFKQPLEQLGHQISITEMNSGLTAILIQKNAALITARDRRRE